MRMKDVRRALVAVGSTVALAVAGVSVPAAQATVTENGSKVVSKPSAQGSLASATVDNNSAERHAELAFENPSAFAEKGALFTRLSGYVYLGDKSALGNNKSKQVWQQGGADVVELRDVDSATGIEIVRTYRFQGDSATLEVSLRNTSGREQSLQVDLVHQGVYSTPKFTATRGANPIVARSTSPEYEVKVEFGGNPQSTGFSGGDVWNDAKYGQDGTKGFDGGGGAYKQGGRWYKPLKAGETFTGSVTVTATPSGALADKDNDGIPDDWERGSVTPTGTNEKLDLARWGASPDAPDVFLQLNWMVPEVTTKSCAAGGRYARNPEGFANYLECAEANKNEYRPSKKALNDLVDLFKSNGINLHIDAGEWYNNFTKNPAEFKGGPTVGYKLPYYSSDQAIKGALESDRKKFLGGRDAVFRLGIIGDNLAPGDYSSGVSTTPGGSFYVAKQSLMTSDEQVRNTILHELGHNIGLTHGGSMKAEANRNLNYLPNYVSTMNYLYQYSHFGYTGQESRSGGSLPAVCNSKPCYKGSYTVPADWQNLALRDGILGRATGTVSREEIHSEDATIRELEVAAADKNNGKGGFRLIDDAAHHNGIIPVLGDNYLTGELTNRGRQAHKFTVQVTAGDGKPESHTFEVEGIPAKLPDDDSTNPKAGKRQITLPLTVDPGFTGSEMPVRIQVFNAKGEVQYNESLNIPVLDYTSDELQKVMKDVLADPKAPEKSKAAARQVLQRPSNPNRPGAAPKPNANTGGQNAGGQTGGNTTGGSSGSSNDSGSPRNTGAIIAGSVIGLLAIIAAAVAVLFVPQRPDQPFFPR